MTDMQAVFQLVDSLTEEEKNQLLEYLEETISLSPQGKRIPDLFAGHWMSDADEPRVLGLFAGKGYWMSDDFDDELPDEFWNFDEDFGL